MAENMFSPQKKPFAHVNFTSQYSTNSTKGLACNVDISHKENTEEKKNGYVVIIEIATDGMGNRVLVRGEAHPFLNIRAASG
jgi:hypothetical protein